MLDISLTIIAVTVISICVWAIYKTFSISITHKLIDVNYVRIYILL